MTVATSRSVPPREDSRGAPINVRLQPDLLHALEKWIGKDDITRPEAVRQVLEFALIPKPGSLTVSAARGARIDAWAERHGATDRVDAILQLIDLGLKAKPK